MLLPPAALMPLLCAWSGVSYDELGRSSEALQRVVIPLELLSLLWLLLITRWAGWWPGRLQVGPFARLPRVFWSLPVLWGVACAQRLGAVAWPEIDAAEVAWLLLATALVGLTEELMFRGLVVWAARGGRSGRAWLECRALWASAFAFGLFHLPNVASGQALALTGVQVLMATLMGVIFFLARRLSGGLWLPVLMHWAWDFSTIAMQRSASLGPAELSGAAWAAGLNGLLALGALLSLGWFSLRERSGGF
ncbi:CPBP family intramembrane metalloprotease [Curvibacter sp. HBC28]|uniref:CPBP family intramembrane metalloprotease n=1 Tax=Curvibacter microcysteis TaxID=3026419 RepID=A0ABT5MFA7_9BURK|nr:CPBP family intramembrane glutamic endopeptidase [Curvibacter sp. HBC28]MDD0815261.1 CPBP family intramembrane metalloprotease [Curvibacter sp. HBC28]